MTFTDDQFATLSQYERVFKQALDQQVGRAISDRDVTIIANIYHEATQTPRRNYSCAICRYNLLRRCGSAYRRDKRERESQTLENGA